MLALTLMTNKSYHGKNENARGDFSFFSEVIEYLADGLWSHFVYPVKVKSSNTREEIVSATKHSGLFFVKPLFRFSLDGLPLKVTSISAIPVDHAPVDGADGQRIPEFRVTVIHRS